ncbi:MAG: hypothetical protein HS103_00030 [Anaerolineales bacterium]|nr:hypothetical protein [Anaerolineales bacterium]
MRRNGIRVFTILFITIFLIIAKLTTLKAQATIDFVVHLGSGDYEHSWSWDSQYFIFQGYEWFSYDVQNKQLAITEGAWPLQVPLTEAQRQAFEVGTDPDGNTSFFLRSPNGRYIVYVTSHETDKGSFGNANSLGLADLTSEEHVLLEGTYTDYFDNFRANYEVLWSADSSAFILNHHTLAPKTFYISNFNEGLNNTNIVSLHDGIRVGDVTLTYFKLYDISLDGDYLLLGVPDKRGLTIWQTRMPHETLFVPLVDRGLGFGKFVAGHHAVRYITSTGLYEHNILTRATTLISSDLNTAEGDRFWFSPDGNKVAIMKDRDFYMAYLPAYTEPTPTPLPTAFPHPTGYPGGDPVCPGGGGEWMWENGFPIFICQPNWE